MLVLTYTCVLSSLVVCLRVCVRLNCFRGHSFIYLFLLLLLFIAQVDTGSRILSQGSIVAEYVIVVPKAMASEVSLAMSSTTASSIQVFFV